MPCDSRKAGAGAGFFSGQSQWFFATIASCQLFAATMATYRHVQRHAVFMDEAITFDHAPCDTAAFRLREKRIRLGG